jgi:hypothetical protein
LNLIPQGSGTEGHPYVDDDDIMRDDRELNSVTLVRERPCLSAKLMPTFEDRGCSVELFQTLIIIQGVSKELYNDILNVAVWRVLRKRLHLKEYKLSIAFKCKRFHLERWKGKEDKKRAHAIT